jgi:hypothetical protein
MADDSETPTGQTARVPPHKEEPDQSDYLITIQVTDATIWDIITKTGYKPYVSTAKLIFDNEQWDADLVTQQEADLIRQSSTRLVVWNFSDHL